MRSLWPVAVLFLLIAVICFAIGNYLDHQRFKAFEDCVKAHVEICQ